MQAIILSQLFMAVVNTLHYNTDDVNFKTRTMAAVLCSDDYYLCSVDVLHQIIQMDMDMDIRPFALRTQMASAMQRSAVYTVAYKYGGIVAPIGCSDHHLVTACLHITNLKLQRQGDKKAIHGAELTANLSKVAMAEEFRLAAQVHMTTTKKRSHIEITNNQHEI